MNKKRGYLLVFEQLQPIHTGMRRYGVLSETRIFITGQAMWGALTNGYGKQNAGDYPQRLFETVSCFYPSFDRDPEKVKFPRFENGEFYLGDYSEYEFRNEFVDTYISTSIKPYSLTAKDESLHEMEVILPRSKKGGYKQLYWIGLLWIDDELRRKFLKENELEILAGGDSRYGLGKLLLKNVLRIHKNNLTKWGFEHVGSNGKCPIFRLNDRPLTNFLAEPKRREGLTGKLELLVEFNFQKGTPEVVRHCWCFTPGSIGTRLEKFTLRKGKCE